MSPNGGRLPLPGPRGRLGRGQRGDFRRRRGLAGQPLEPTPRRARPACGSPTIWPTALTLARRSSSTSYNLETNPRSARPSRRPRRSAVEVPARRSAHLGTQTPRPGQYSRPGRSPQRLKRRRPASAWKVRISKRWTSRWPGPKASPRQVDLRRSPGGALSRKRTWRINATLPPHQRADFTFWGLEDSQSWLRRENPSDAPLLFDDQGRAKPAAAAWERALTR